MHAFSTPVSPGADAPRIAVVGLGFSGAAVALHLLRELPAGATLWLIDPAARRGRGLAYGTRCASHWLNVPAGRLGIETGHEAGFVEWLRGQYGSCGAGDFVPRLLLGDYLAHTLAEAEKAALTRGVQVRMVRAGAVDVGPGPAPGVHLVRLDDGQALEADRVVLALGHLAPESPRLPGAPPWGSPGLIDQPWDESALAALPEDGDVLLLGSGLSAIDMLTWLQDRGHAGRLTMLSRRGLLPQPHRSLEAQPRPAGPAGQALSGAHSLRQMLRVVRRWADEAAETGGDWRDVMASLRPDTPALWQRLPVRERRQFLRHLQPWWDTHRHRLAPGIHCRLRAALQAGQAEVRAGRVRSVLPLGERSGFEVSWAPRGSDGPLEHRRVAAIVNCTGPSARVGHAARTVPGTLLAAMQAHGRLCVDPLGLGLAVDGQHRLLDAEGRPQAGLYYVGPMLKAQHWEAVAIPELRVHAQAIAEELLQGLAVSA
ncbi:FAD/NAD(P)-binding protein [Ideonella sp. YS5]|uniref:FAD/NAD(P)-binding protein n=1 Tax=Ideonella sp. YS5 TaxID=3453714 RepID=UPI003EEFD10B